LHSFATVQLTLAKVTGCEPHLHVQQGTAAFLKADSGTVTQEIPRFFFESGCSFSCLQDPATGPHLEPVESSPFPSTLTFISKLPSHLPIGFPSVLFLSGFSSSFYINSLPSPCLLLVQPIQAALYVAYHIINKHVS